MREAYYGGLLRSSMHDFRAGRSSLQRLVDDVEAISESIHVPEVQEAIQQCWWELELVLAVEVHERGAKSLNADAEQRVHGAVDALEGLATELEEAL